MTDAPALTDRQAALTVEGLSFGYVEGQEVITDLSAALAPGTLTVLLGPNAVGKTTLLRLMLGQLDPGAGRILLDRRDVATLAAPRRAARISYVPQRSEAGFAFTVEAVAAMGRFALRRDDAAVDRALEMADLTDLRHRVFSQLSIGQQQRVLLARAIAQSIGEGRVMLLDEPGSGMDLYHVHHMMQRLVTLAKEGLAVLAVLHDLNLAIRYAHEVWLMDQGRLVASGAWDQVLQPPVLEPVYRVPLRLLYPDPASRPVLVVPEKPPIG